VAALRGPRDREVEAFATLLTVDGLGPARIRRLWETHGSGKRALDSLDDTPDSRSALCALAQAARLGVRTVPLGAPDYPAAFYDLTDPPPVLYVRGSGWPDPTRSVAVVGTRRASPYGRRIARRLSRDLARWGWTVVSGMAAGIDAAAHEAALDASGPTMGVLGTGHAHEYPWSNRPLYARMKRRGWLVSELEPSAGPRRTTFPTRNRLIAAASRALIVVEAGDRSGALGTARRALALGREVLAVPARIGDRTGVGTLRLLRDGAGLVTDVRDVFDALGWIHDLEPPPERRSKTGEGTGSDGWLLSALGGEERTVDEVATVCGRSIGDTVAALGRLEVDGRVGRSADGTFFRTDGSQSDGWGGEDRGAGGV